MPETKFEDFLLREDHDEEGKIIAASMNDLLERWAKREDTFEAEIIIL